MTAYSGQGTVSEDDVYELFQRYGASTVFALLQEVSQAAEKDATIDWRVLVKCTSTGISNEREYQMLWHHLAYRDPMEKVEDDGELLSDESDLDFELEATPIPSIEVLAEADCFAKALLSSGSVGDCTSVLALSAEAAFETGNEQDSTTPIYKQNSGALKQPSLPCEGQDGNTISNLGLPAKKKRKLWTKEEDLELISAVEKFGEGNWANILKGDFKHDRTASQLSQRWAIIRKRRTASKQSTGGKTRSEEMLAAQKAFSIALNMPMSGSLSSLLSGGKAHLPTSIAGAPDESKIAAGSRTFKPSISETSSQKAPPIKPRFAMKKPPAQSSKTSICPNPLIKAAAFAAGGRIATPSTAASLLKAAQSRNAVRIRHSAVAGAPLMAPSIGGMANPKFTLPSVSLKSCSSGAAAISSKLGVGKGLDLPSPEPMQQEIAKRQIAGVNGSGFDVDELLMEEDEEEEAKAAENGDSLVAGEARADHREVSENQ